MSIKKSIIQNEPDARLVDYSYAVGDSEPPPEQPKKKKKPTKAELKERRLKLQKDRKKAELRYYLKQELELSKKSVEKGWGQWEEMCKDIKIKELREELQAWGVKSRRVVERKDEKIQMMVEDMSTICEMHQRGFEKHVQIMNYITDVFDSFLDVMKQMYEANCFSAIQEDQDEIASRKRFFEEAKDNREKAMYASNVVFERQLASDLRMFQERQDDVVNSEIVRRYAARDKVLEDMKKLRKQLLIFVEELQANALDPHKSDRIKSLMDRQRLFVVENKSLNAMELSLLRQHVDLQREHLRKDMDGKRRVSELKLELSYFQAVRIGLEAQLKEEREKIYERLRIVTSESHKVLEKYRKMVKQGEGILSLVTSCRKLQTQKEKIIAWDNFRNVEDPEQNKFVKEHFKLQALDLARHLNFKEEDLTEQCELMKNFWQRVAAVEMHNMLLSKEKRRLIKENEEYCERIRAMGTQATDRVEELLETVNVQSVMSEKNLCPVIPRKRRSRYSARQTLRKSRMSRMMSIMRGSLALDKDEKL